MQECYHLERTQKQCHGMQAKKSAKTNQYNIYLHSKPREKCRSVITWNGHKSNVMECRQSIVQKPTDIKLPLQQTKTDMQECYHLEWTQKQCHGMQAKKSAKANRYKPTFTANQDRNAGVLSLGMNTKAMSWNAGKEECKSQQI